MDRRRGDAEVSLQVSFSRRPAEDARIFVGEGQILTLPWRETWSKRRRHRYIVSAGVMCDKHLFRVNEGDGAAMVEAMGEERRPASQLRRSPWLRRHRERHHC